MILYAMVSPAIVFLAVSCAFYLVKRYWLPKADFKEFLWVCSISSSILSGIALIIIMVSGGWYTYRTGYDANQSFLVWVLLYGPASFAVGEIVGFFFWIKRQN
jgi:hypothetical protein